MIRVATNHKFVAHSEKGGVKKKNLGSLHIRVYVWFTRLIFEMIADPAIKDLMDSLHQPIVAIQDVVKKRTCEEPMFRSTDLAYHEDPAYKYSMAGLMKFAESHGYPMSDGAPDRLGCSCMTFSEKYVSMDA